MAYKDIDYYDKNLTREDYECNLNFLGFSILKNKLKKGTVKALKELKKAKIKYLMCTGDNIYTSIATGYKTGIIGKNEAWFICRLNEEKKNIKWENNEQNNNNLSF